VEQCREPRSIPIAAVTKSVSIKNTVESTDGERELRPGTLAEEPDEALETALSLSAGTPDVQGLVLCPQGMEISNDTKARL
jgi:hypothetical protein